MIVVDASAVLEVLLRGPRADRVDERLLVHRTVCEDLTAMPITRYAHLPLLPRIWSLRDTLTAYDAACLALAEALGAKLVTCDAALRAAAGRAADVVLID